MLEIIYIHHDTLIARHKKDCKIAELVIRNY